MTTTLTQLNNQPNIAQGTITTNGESITLERPIGAVAVTVQVTGTWTGTLTFQASVDGTNFVTYFMTPSNSNTDAGTTTANGAWGKQNNGYRKFRVAATASITGTVAITIAGLRLT